MADIRIKDLATTASSTASDDFLAVDGSANGTRKLNAYSPTFGGNLTVSGTGTSSVAGTLLVATTTNSSNGAVQLATHTTSAGGIGFGTDTSLFRVTSNKLELRGTADAEFSFSFNRTAGSYQTKWENYIAAAGTSLVWYNGGDRLTLDTSGNATFAGQVYLNTSSPPAWDAASFNVIVAGSNAFGGTNTGSNNLIVASNTYFNGSVFKYATAGYATAYRQLVGRHEFYVAVSGSANATTTLVPSLIIQNAGTLTLSQYGAGTLSTDASGNVTASSDARLKTNLRTFARGLADVLKLAPKTYNWNETSGLDTANDYVGFVAQDVQSAIPEAVYEGKDSNKTLTLNDRAILAALVNAVKELNAKLA